MKNRISTLVIHPDDRSTDFLKKIYEGKDWTIINDIPTCKSRKTISELIKNHDRIIMMGHGYPYGLFYTCINPEMVYLLRQKECVCIWCNADQFVERYKLRGFYTGMFISEVGEANHFKIKTTQEAVDYSNNLFAELVNRSIDTETLHEDVKSLYVGDCPVIRYNNDRLYFRNQSEFVSSTDLIDDIDNKLIF